MLQKLGPYTGRRGLKEGKEDGEMQVEQEAMLACASLGVWEEELGTRWCGGGEEGGQARRGVQKEEVGESQGHGHLALSAQHKSSCREVGNTKHQQTKRRTPNSAKQARPGTHATFFYGIGPQERLTGTSMQRKMAHSAPCRHLDLGVT